MAESIRLYVLRACPTWRFTLATAGTLSVSPKDFEHFKIQWRQKKMLQHLKKHRASYVTAASRCKSFGALVLQSMMLAVGTKNRQNSPR